MCVYPTCTHEKPDAYVKGKHLHMPAQFVQAARFPIIVTSLLTYMGTWTSVFSIPFSVVDIVLYFEYKQALEGTRLAQLVCY